MRRYPYSNPNPSLNQRRSRETLTQTTKKTRTRAEETINLVLRAYERSWTPRREDPFKTLIRTILSQNTNWRNEDTAYRRLDEMIGITQRSLAEAPLEKIAEAIKPAGMYNTRSKIIKQVSEQIITKFDGDLTSTVSKPFQEARSDLMTLPGVGEKTADVVLLFNAGKHVIPVDRHIARIAKRLEIVPPNAPYDQIRTTLEQSTPPETYLETHIKLIQLGREKCRPQNPKCPTCPLNTLCPQQTKQTPPTTKQPKPNPQNPKQTQ
jgi:endonuclease-3